MSTAHPPYRLVITTARTTITAEGNARMGENLGVEIFIDGRKIGCLEVFQYAMPGYALSDDLIVVWSRTRLHLVPLRMGEIMSLENQDQVVSAYLVAGNLCVVGETSVALLDLATGKDAARVAHDEIIVSSYWQDHVLNIEDLEGRRFSLEIAEGNIRFT